MIEDLQVAGMLKNRNLARAIADVGFFEFRRQLEYKAAMASCTIVVADRWFASSKRCSGCRVTNESLTLAERTWTCGSCGLFHDRELNAARNLALLVPQEGPAESSPAAACRAEGAGGEQQFAAKPAA